MAGRRKRTLLTNLELEVMRVVWSSPQQPLTVREVAERLNRAPKGGRRRRQLAYNTIQTMLTILRDKGVVEAHSGAGRAHLYASRVTEEEVRTSMVGDLVDRLFDGEVRPLLVQLVGDESLNRAELETLKELIEDQLDDEASS